MHTVQKIVVLSGCANRHYFWYHFISLIIFEGDHCRSEFRLRLRPSLCDMAVSNVLPALLQKEVSDLDVCMPLVEDVLLGPDFCGNHGSEFSLFSEINFRFT